MSKKDVMASYNHDSLAFDTKEVAAILPIDQNDPYSDAVVVLKSGFTITLYGRMASAVLRDLKWPLDRRDI